MKPSFKSKWNDLSRLISYNEDGFQDTFCVLKAGSPVGTRNARVVADGVEPRVGDCVDELPYMEVVHMPKVDVYEEAQNAAEYNATQKIGVADVRSVTSGQT